MVLEQWERAFGGGDCRTCHLLNESVGYADCQVVSGAEAVHHCPVWQAHVETNEIRLPVRLRG